MKRIIFGIIVLTGGGVLALLFFMPVSTLTVRLPREGHRMVEAARVSPGDVIDLSYRHSVERTRVVPGRGALYHGARPDPGGHRNTHDLRGNRSTQLRAGPNPPRG